MYRFVFLLAILLRVTQGEASSQEEFGKILTHLQHTIREVHAQQDATQTRLLRGAMSQHSLVEIQILEVGKGFYFG
jgi:hypothetical protein